MTFGKIILILSIFLTFAPRAQAALFTDDTWTTDKGHFDVDYWVDY